MGAPGMMGMGMGMGMGLMGVGQPQHPQHGQAMLFKVSICVSVRLPISTAFASGAKIWCGFEP